MRGDIAHMVFEVLGNPRHFQRYIKKIIKANSVLIIPSIKKLIEKRAKTHRGFDLAAPVVPIRKKDPTLDTLTCIDEMIMIGIKTDFIDLKDKELIKSELAFDITNESPSYRIVGFVDRIFREGKDTISFSDMKTSKKKYSPQELKDNIQALVYLCAARKLYPELKKRKARFIMLRFPDDPIQEVNEVTDEQLDGFEYHLESISEYMRDFTPEKARYKTQAPLTRARGGGLCFSARTGHRCPYLDPMDYYHLIDNKTQKVLKSAKEHDKREKQKGATWIKKHFLGCEMWKFDRPAKFS